MTSSSSPPRRTPWEWVPGYRWCQAWARHRQAQAFFAQAMGWWFDLLSPQACMEGWDRWLRELDRWAGAHVWDIHPATGEVLGASLRYVWSSEPMTAALLERGWKPGSDILHAVIEDTHERVASITPSSFAKRTAALGRALAVWEGRQPGARARWLGTQDQGGRTPLEAAIVRGAGASAWRLALVTWLLKEGAAVEGEPRRWRTQSPLGTWPAQPSLNGTCAPTLSPLALAVQANDCDVAQKLLSHGASWATVPPQMWGCGSAALQALYHAHSRKERFNERWAAVPPPIGRPRL